MRLGHSGLDTADWTQRTGHSDGAEGYPGVHRIEWSFGMRRRILLGLALIFAASLLAGCDKCGDWQKFNTPSLPKSCHGEPPAG